MSPLLAEYPGDEELRSLLAASRDAQVRAKLAGAAAVGSGARVTDVLRRFRGGVGISADESSWLDVAPVVQAISISLRRPRGVSRVRFVRGSTPPGDDIGALVVVAGLRTTYEPWTDETGVGAITRSKVTQRIRSATVECNVSVVDPITREVWWRSWPSSTDRPAPLTEIPLASRDQVINLSGEPSKALATILEAEVLRASQGAMVRRLWALRGELRWLEVNGDPKDYEGLRQELVEALSSAEGLTSCPDLPHVAIGAALLVCDQRLPGRRAGQPDPAAAAATLLDELAAARAAWRDRQMAAGDLRAGLSGYAVLLVSDAPIELDDPDIARLAVKLVTRLDGASAEAKRLGLGGRTGVVLARTPAVAPGMPQVAPGMTQAEHRAARDRAARDNLQRLLDPKSRIDLKQGHTALAEVVVRAMFLTHGLAAR